MSASHHGEDAHVRTIQAVLRRAGLSQSLLACGTDDAPADTMTAARLAREGETPGPDSPHVLGVPHVEPAAVADSLAGRWPTTGDPSTPARLLPRTPWRGSSGVRRAGSRHCRRQLRRADLRVPDGLDRARVRAARGSGQWRGRNAAVADCATDADPRRDASRAGDGRWHRATRSDTTPDARAPGHARVEGWRRGPARRWAFCRARAAPSPPRPVSRSRSRMATGAPAPTSPSVSRRSGQLGVFDEAALERLNEFHTAARRATRAASRSRATVPVFQLAPFSELG